MSGVPPTAGLRSGPRFGVLGLAFGSGVPAAKIGTANGGGRGAINALPPARTALGQARLSSRADLRDQLVNSSVATSQLAASASSAALVVRGKVSIVQLSGKASSAAVATVSKTTSSQMAGSARSAALATRTVTVSARFASKASSAVTANVARLASSQMQSSARMAAQGATAGNKTATSSLSGKASSAVRSQLLTLAVKHH